LTTDHDRGALSALQRMAPHHVSRSTLGVTLLMMLCWAGAPAVSAQDLQPDLDLPQESGPAQVKSPQPSPGKEQPEKGVLPPPAEAAP
jgi:hypothetical protein